jgi:hypothetical protein
MLGAAMLVSFVLGSGGHPRVAEAAGGPGRSVVRTMGSGVLLGPAVILGFNDLGMHCMNQDFSEICILPPFNNLHAQVILRGEEPRILSSGVTVRYNVPGNTFSTGKTNFWDFAQALFGVPLRPNVGLTGNRLAGLMKPTGNGDWEATGIPITPIDDAGALNPYPLAKITALQAGKVIARTRAVVPVSWEISCNICHDTPGVSVATDILRKHDARHGTQLEASKPVLCARCHADPALGTPGLDGVSTLSHAMHGSHAARLDAVNLTNKCYACHPGFETNCQRDIHFAKGIHCVDCHGSMADVAAPDRTPWVDEPTCASCHSRLNPRLQYEEPGKLYKVSHGHHGVLCASCHGSPHAITPTVTAPDNVQAIGLQGHAGVIDTCAVCHKQRPDDRFDHRYEGADD